MATLMKFLCNYVYMYGNMTMTKFLQALRLSLSVDVVYLISLRITDSYRNLSACV